MIWETLGVLMIIPTLSAAIFISYRTRHIASELAHNIAVTFWITANSYWMISEFYGFDETVIWRGYEGKHMAMIPFLIGIGTLFYFYLVQRPREIAKNREVTM